MRDAVAVSVALILTQLHSLSCGGAPVVDPASAAESGGGAAAPATEAAAADAEGPEARSNPPGDAVVEAGIVGGAGRGCGVGAQAAPEPAPGEPFPDDRVELEDDTLNAFARQVLESAEGVGALVDWSRADTVARAIRELPDAEAELDRGERVRSLRLALEAIPRGCEPGFSEGDGYSVLAIPPAMTDMPDALAAIVDTAIGYLQEGTELFIDCMYWEEKLELDGEGEVVSAERIPVVRPALVLNVWRSPSGDWRIVAWAAMQGVESGFYPE